VDAAKGLLADAITAMNGSTVVGLGSSQIMSLVSDARIRLSGERLSKFNQEQMVAAVCGSTWLAAVTQGDANCPSMITDVVLKFPDVNMPSMNTILDKLDVQGGSASFTARILSTLDETDRPNMASARRLSTTAETEVTVRMSFPNAPANGDNTVASIQQAAEALATTYGGSASASQHNVTGMPPGGMHPGVTSMPPGGMHPGVTGMPPTPPSGRCLKTSQAKYDIIKRKAEKFGMIPVTLPMEACH
jgi:hypothetical protein